MSDESTSRTARLLAALAGGVLWLGPRDFRVHYGPSLVGSFATMLGDERARRGVGPMLVLWMRGVFDALRAVGRERRLVRSSSGRPPFASLPTDLRSSWRGIRARGWSAIFVVLLLAVVLAGNVLMFAVADALVFNRAPFPEADRIVDIGGATQPPERFDLKGSTAVLDAWRAQTDLVRAAGSFQPKTLFVRRDGSDELVRTLDVTMGFFDVLGQRPRWGRSFVPGDETDTSAMAVIISEDFARRHFGDPSLAPGRVLQATAGKLAIVGVMDAQFAFPNPGVHIWRALDPAGPLARNVGSFRTFARIASSVPVDRLEAAIAERGPLVGRAAGLSTYRPLIQRHFAAAPTERRAMMLLLLGAAVCLLVGACANIASLELAVSAKRATTSAIQLALGAPRWRLARVAAVEGFVLVGSGLLVGLALAWASRGFLRWLLPDSLRLATNHPVALDLRAYLFMCAVAVAAWLVASLPAVLAALKSSLVPPLKLETRTAAASRSSTRLRRALTTVEVAIAVAIVVVGILYASSYQKLLAVEKGFDSRNLYEVSWMMPGLYFRMGTDSFEFGRRATQHLREVPGVQAVTRSSPPPNTGNSPSEVTPELDSRGPSERPILMGAHVVDVGYFHVVNLPLKSGRLPEETDSDDVVILPESTARRLFSGQDATGHALRLMPSEPWLTVIGVVGDFRTDRTRMPQPEDRELHYYKLFKPEVQRPPTRVGVQGAPPTDDGVTTMYSSRMVRTNGHVSEAELLAAARLVDPRLPVEVESVDQMYANQSADTRMASRIVGAFAVLAFAIAMAGVYGVMAFLVTGRTREIGIRMSLGADAASIRRLVLSSGVQMVAVGAVTGLAIAAGASRWFESQLFGVSATSPAVYALTAATVVAVSLFATWHPARQASRVDPVVTLRSD